MGTAVNEALDSNQGETTTTVKDALGPDVWDVWMLKKNTICHLGIGVNSEVLFFGDDQV